jgi:hypothetical protein
MLLDTRNKNVYMVFGWGSQRFARYSNTFGLRETGPLRMVMTNVPSDATTQETRMYMVWGDNIYGLGVGISTFFEIFGHFFCQGDGTTP